MPHTDSDSDGHISDNDSDSDGHISDTSEAFAPLWRTGLTLSRSVAHTSTRSEYADKFPLRYPECSKIVRAHVRLQHPSSLLRLVWPQLRISEDHPLSGVLQLVRFQPVCPPTSLQLLHTTTTPMTLHHPLTNTDPPCLCSSEQLQPLVDASVRHIRSTAPDIASALPGTSALEAAKISNLIKLGGKFRPDFDQKNFLKTIVEKMVPDIRDFLSSILRAKAHADLDEDLKTLDRLLSSSVQSIQADV